MLKFIHAADLHLDSPMRGLADYPGAPLEEIRGATRTALEALVNLALEEEVHLVLIAGDLYDGDWKDYNTGLFLATQMSRLREAGIKAIIASGNHDAASQITRHLQLPDNVTRLSTKHPESKVFDDCGVVVHGQGFRNRHVTENVIPTYPPARPDLFNIGMLHTSAGLTGHDEYAPCRPQDLLDRGYQYWALGHIHRYEALSAAPWIVFPGNLQGRHIRETGPKGCVVVTMDDGAVQVERRHLAVVQWELCPISSADCQGGYELLERMRGEVERLVDESAAPTLATRVLITDDSPAREQFLAEPERWLNEARLVVTDAGAGAAWLEKLVVEPVASDAPVLAKSLPDGTAMEMLQTANLLPASIEALADEPALKDLLAKLPRELREPPDGLDLSDDVLSQLAPRARALLLSGLEKRGDEE